MSSQLFLQFSGFASSPKGADAQVTSPFGGCKSPSEWERVHGVDTPLGYGVLDGDFSPLFGDPCRHCPLNGLCSGDECGAHLFSLDVDTPEPFSWEEWVDDDFDEEYL